MYVMNGTKTYTAISNLQFSPQVDMTNDALPINEYSVDIATTDALDMSPYLDLYDDLDNLWAHYVKYNVIRISPDVVRVRARSELQEIDGVTLYATMYTGQTAQAVLDDVMVCQVGGGLSGTIDYTLDSTLQSVTITGFCPEQSARERLQWVCTVIGAYVKTAFNDKPEILPIDNTSTLIPMNRTFMRPSATTSEVVTELRVTAFSFATGTPSTTDEYVTDANDTHYIVTRQEMTLTNSAAPSSAPDNVVAIDNLYLVNSGNASAILTRLAARYFKNTSVALDVIDNAEYVPGDMVTVYADRETLYTGFIESAGFKFGKQARASLKLAAADVTEGATLTITYTWNDITVALETYTLPVGYSYSIQTRYIDTQINGHRYILRPTTATVSGTMISSGDAVTVTCAVALDLFGDVLHVVSVDEVSDNGEGVVTIE